MNNGENIKQYRFTSDQDRVQAAINGRKGGKALVAKKRRNKDLGELLEKFMDAKVKSADAIAMLQNMGFDEEECTNRAAFMLNMQKFASKGNSAYTKMIVEIEQNQKQRKIELKRLKLENEKLEEEIKRIKLENETMKAKIEGKNDVEDLTPLAKLLQDEDDEAEIEREVSEDGD